MIRLQKQCNTRFEDEAAINVFDFWKGANFKLKIRKVDGYWNYDKSEFEGVSAVVKMMTRLNQSGQHNTFKSVFSER